MRKSSDEKSQSLTGRVHRSMEKTWQGNILGLATGVLGYGLQKAARAPGTKVEAPGGHFEWNMEVDWLRGDV